MTEIASLAELAARAYLRSGRPVPESGITTEAREALAAGFCERRIGAAAPDLESRSPHGKFVLLIRWTSTPVGEPHRVRARVGREIRSRACKRVRGIESGILSTYLDGGLCTHATRGGRVVKRHAIPWVATACPYSFCCTATISRSPRGGTSLHSHCRTGWALEFVFPRVRLT